MPMADLTVPERSAPASVTPRCRGQSMASDSMLIGGHGHEHVGGLHADLELVEVVVLQDAGVAQRALDHGLGAGLAVALQQVALQRAGVDADAHGAAVVAGGLDHLAHAVGRADVAGVDAQAGRAGLRPPRCRVCSGSGCRPRSGTRTALAMALKAAVDSSSGQDTRTMSAPASSSWRICSMVAAASAVRVLVIDWTVIGASPPTGTSRHGSAATFAGRWLARDAGEYALECSCGP